ncbi:MAG: hypothetical protein HWE25_01020 [Alphaproteobacteria bacterium]|nr:hypothetical protein [Alphaproteobacteria bacterium]
MMEFLTQVPDPVWFAGGGAIGYKLLDFLELYKLPKSQWPNFGKLYWLALAIHALLGGGLAFVYVSAGQNLGAIVAVNIGITAPFLLRTIANQADSPIEVPDEA